MARVLVYERVGAIAQMTEKEKAKFDLALKKLNRTRKLEGKRKVVLTELLRQLILSATSNPQLVLDFLDYDDNN